jgi:predicted metal-dependent hydrolase
MLSFPLRTTVNRRLKHTYLQLENDGTLHIKTPRRLSTEEMDKLLLSHARWIKKAKERIACKRNNVLLPSGGYIYLWGECIPLRYSRAKKERFFFSHDAFIYEDEKFDTCKVNNHLDAFYKKKAQRTLVSIVEHYAEHMQLFPERITFRKTKRQWGSCSTHNRISLNTMLAKVPIELAEYVIVHELAHIRYKHHQKAFWELVESILPDYVRRRKELKRYVTV